MGFMSWLTGKKERMQQIPTLTGQQQQFQNQALQQLQGLLQPGGGLDFAPIEAQARRGFATKTVPGIAEMFTRMGEGGMGSSAFAGALGSAGSELETNLAAMRPQFSMQMLNALRGPAMQQSFDTYHQPAEQGFLGAVAPMAARAGMAYLTGGISEAGGLANLFGMGKQQKQTQPGFGSDQLQQLMALLNQFKSGSPQGYNETYQG
jgi:hypothetical protein